MAHKVLNLLWNLAHSDDVPVDIMDQALSAHIKILDYSCSQVNIFCLVVIVFGLADIMLVCSYLSLSLTATSLLLNMKW